MNIKFTGLADLRIHLLHEINKGEKKDMLNLIYGISNNETSYLREITKSDTYITHDKVRNLLKVCFEACIKMNLNDCVEICYSLNDISEYVDTLSMNCELLKHACAYDNVDIVDFMLTSPYVKFKPSNYGLNEYSSLTSSYKVTPLGIASLYNSKKVISYFMSKPNIKEMISEYDFVSIKMAIKGDNDEILSSFLKIVRDFKNLKKTFYTDLFIESIKVINSSAIKSRKVLIIETPICSEDSVISCLSALNYQDEIKMLESKSLNNKLKNELQKKSQTKEAINKI